MSGRIDGATAPRYRGVLRSLFSFVEDFCDFHAVFVAAAGEVDDEDFVFAHRLGEAHCISDGVGGLERGDDAFALATSWKASSA